MSIPINNASYLPFHPGDWVKVIKKPRDAIAIAKGDIIQADGVNPKARMIRTLDPEAGWQHLGFDEVEAAHSPPGPVGTGTTEVSSRDDKKRKSDEVARAYFEIKEILERFDVSSRDDIINQLMSVRDDKCFKTKLSVRDDSPRVIWRSPGGRSTKYPWFECGKQRAYIGGGDRNSVVAQKRVEVIHKWIGEKIPPGEILRRVKAKEFQFDPPD